MYHSARWYVLLVCLVGYSQSASDEDVALIRNEVNAAMKEETMKTNQQLEQIRRQLETLISKQESQATQQQLGQVQQQMDAVLNKLATSSMSAVSTRSLDSTPLPRDCADVMSNDAKTSGVYTVYVGTMKRPVQVYCDMATDGGGWTVFQRRQDGTENFYRKWTDYEAGFGNLNGEHWLGNDILHRLTSGQTYRLRVDLGDWNGNTRYAEYSNFKVGSACEKYKLVSLGAYCGTAGDSMTAVHLGQKFSTLDQDNDIYATSCAQQFKGGWWYSNCHDSNLNGLYLRGPFKSYADGVTWQYWTGDQYSLKFTEMKIRPSDF